MGGSDRQTATLAVLLVVSLFLAPAASFGPAFLGGIGRLGSFAPPRGEGGWRAAGQAVVPKATLLSRNQLVGKRQGARLSMMSERDISDETTLPTGLLEELDSGVRLNDLLLVQDFVTSGFVDASLALHRAANADCSNEMLDMLIETGGELDWADSSGRTPLMCAVTRKSLSMAAALLSKGADVELGGNSYSGRTPLMQAASSGHLEIVQLLLDAGADPNAEDRFGRSVLVQAAMMGKKDIVRRLEKFNREGKTQKRRSLSKELMKMSVGDKRATQRRRELKDEEDGMVELDRSVEAKLWNSLISDSTTVEGRPEVFMWKGQVLRQPEPLANGAVVIYDDNTGEVVYQGFPAVPGEADVDVDQGDHMIGYEDVAGNRRGSPSGAVDLSGIGILKTAVRVAVSPAVAVTRIASAATKRLTSITKKKTKSRVRRDPEGAAAGVTTVKKQQKATTAKKRSISVEVNSDEDELPAGFKGIKKHQAEVAMIAERVSKRKEGQQVTLSRRKGESHCPRSDEYKETTVQVDVSSLNGILGVEEVPGGGWQALVEPRVTMEQLVRTLLPMGFVPEVVPEFRRMTVGGSINGLAGESSSFDKGFFHDTCDTYEVVLGDGRVVLATRENEYADLFEALPGSYGTLGILTAASIRLVKAEPYIAMDYVQFDLISDMMAYIDRALSGEQSPLSDIGFIEGFGYGPDDYLVAQGRFVDEEDALSGTHGKVQKYSKWWSPWFYKRARRRRGGADVVPTEDYLFRHDRGSFWMASYKMPHIVGRAMGWALPSAKMYKLASMLPAVFDKSEILLQDFMIPVDNVESFVDSLDVNLGVWPLWFCPLKNLRTKGLIFGVPANGGHFCNVGAYGIPEKVRFDFEKDNKMMERVMLENGGRKVHYSHAYYPQELFYGQIYDGVYYAELRDRYGAEDAFPHVHQKVVTKEGGKL